MSWQLYYNIHCEITRSAIKYRWWMFAQFLIHTVIILLHNLVKSRSRPTEVDSIIWPQYFFITSLITVGYIFFSFFVMPHSKIATKPPLHYHILYFFFISGRVTSSTCLPAQYSVYHYIGIIKQYVSIFYFTWFLGFIPRPRTGGYQTIFRGGNRDGKQGWAVYRHGAVLNELSHGRTQAVSAPLDLTSEPELPWPLL